MTYDEPGRLLNDCDEAIIVFDHAFRVIYANTDATELFAPPLGALVGCVLWDVPSPFPDSRFGTELRVVFNTRLPRAFVVPGVASEYAFSVRALPYDEGAVAVFVSRTGADEAAETKGTRDVIRLQSLVDLVSDGVFETDTAGIYTYLSPQIVEMLGYDTQEVLGKTPFDMMPPLSVVAVEATIRQIMATQTSFSLLEWIWYSAMGEQVHMESSGTPIYDAAGKWIGYRGIMRNVTTRKRRETVVSDAARKQTRIAERLQRSLLQTAKPTRIPHVEVVTRYEAASSEALVGGDLFDTFRLPSGKVAFLVGDVAGKGLEAASDMAEIKFLLRSYLRESPQPSAALARLNRQMVLRRALNDPRSHFLVCLTVAVMDTNTGETHFAVAGMEPPFVIRAGRNGAEPVVDLVTVGGLPIGTLPAWAMDGDEPSTRLRPGDCFLLYTDGLVEARPPRSDVAASPIFGHERLLSAVRDAATVALSATPPLPVVGICDAVLSAIQRFAGVEPRDDMCLLLARYQPETTGDAVSSTSMTVDVGSEAMVTRIDADWRYTYVDEHISRFTGRAVAELLGRTVWDAFPAFIGTEFDRFIHEVREGNELRTVEMEIVPPGVLYRVTGVPLDTGEMEIRLQFLPHEHAADLSHELEVALQEREDALREREAAVREHEAALRENERSRAGQRRFLTEILANVTEGRLRLCHQASQLPVPPPRLGEAVALSTPRTLAAFRRNIEEAAAVVCLPRERVHNLMFAAGEATMNCIVHAGGGVATLHGTPGGGCLQVRITDYGGGIAEEALHRATLERGYTTKGTMGLGFSLMHSAADRVYLFTGSSGTTVILEQDAVPTSDVYPRFHTGAI